VKVWRRIDAGRNQTVEDRIRALGLRAREKDGVAASDDRIG